MLRTVILALALMQSTVAIAHDSEKDHRHDVDVSDVIEDVIDVTTSVETSVVIAVGPSVPSGYMAEGVYIADPTLWDKFTKAAPEWLVAVVPMLVALMLICRAVSEALLLFAAKTQSNVDNQLAQILATVAALLGRLLGYIGIGMPRRMIIAKADKIVAQELADDVGADRSKDPKPV